MIANGLLRILPLSQMRTASRAFHSHFQISDSENLVYFCSAGEVQQAARLLEALAEVPVSTAYQRITNQGWIYMSSNWLCFYSFILNTETKVKIALKDIQHLKREKSKGFFSDSIVVSTKSNAEHFFCNLLRRDETFDILEDLTNHAMTRMLKSSANSRLEESPIASSAGDLAVGSSRKELLEEQRHNQQFQTIFNLPAGEELIDSVYAVLLMPEEANEPPVQGRLFVSNGFICFLVRRQDAFVARGTDLAPQVLH